MAGSMQGADPEQLAQLATKFANCADAIDSVVADVQRMTRDAHWDGPDARAFQTRLENDLGPNARRSASLVRDASMSLKRSADEQRRTSSVAGSGAAAGIGGFLGGTFMGPFRHAFGPDDTGAASAPRAVRAIHALEPFHAPSRLLPDHIGSTPAHHALLAALGPTQVSAGVPLFRMLESAPVQDAPIEASFVNNRWSDSLLGIEPGSSGS